MTPDQRAAYLSELLENSLAAHQDGDFSVAESGYREVLDGFPNHPVTLDLFGTLLFQTGRATQALAPLEKAVGLDPSRGPAWNHLGSVRASLSDYQGAMQAFQSAVEADPDNVDAWVNLSRLAEQCGERVLSVNAARSAAGRQPESGQVQARLGAALLHSGAESDAVDPLTRATSLLPLDPEPYLHLAIALSTLHSKDSAELAIRKCILITPDKVTSYPHFVLLQKSKAPGAGSIDGIAWAQRATRITPTDPHLWTLLGAELLRHQKVDDGVRETQRALILSPSDRMATFNLPNPLFRMARHEAARAAGYRGFVVSPGVQEFHLMVAEAEFVLGNGALGWKHFDVRRTARFGSERIELPPFWEGAGNPGRLLVAAEQGVGDEYIYLSMLPQLIERCSSITVECDKRNLPLFCRTFPGIQFIERQVVGRENADPYFDYRPLRKERTFDHAVLAGSLPGIFLQDVSKPGPVRVFDVDPEERQRWRDRFLQMGKGPWVGLCWRSGLSGGFRDQLYCSAETMVRALGAGTANYVSLIYNLQPGELDAARESEGCVIYDPEGIDQKNELDRVAAMLSALDAVVSVDTAVCPLAASIGTPTIRLGWSHLRLSDGYDAVLGSCHPMTGNLERFEVDVSLPRAGTALPRILEESRRGK